MARIYPPEYADPTKLRITNWVPPRLVTEHAPRWEGRIIHLKHQPNVWYPAFNWDKNRFYGTNTLITNVDKDALGYVPITLTILGVEVTDKTDYRSFEKPQLSDWNITRRIEYYMDGRTLVTNVRFDRLELSPDSVLVQYTSVSDGIRLRCKMRSNKSSESNRTPEVESVSVNLQPGLHPHNQI
jgi:hypothetical protein